jgi:hypothetical protein
MANIGSDGLVKVRIKGVDAMVRDLAKTNVEHHMAVERGIMSAAVYLVEKVKARFGTYQSTGGSGGGSWARLTWETNKYKLRKWGFSNKPLIGSGGMQNSIRVIPGGKGRLSASVGSDDPKMIYHVYGAPRANVPPRDPLIVAATEEADNCRQKIIDALYTVYK